MPDPNIATPTAMAEHRALGPDPAPRSTRPLMSPRTDSTSNATQAYGQGGNPWPWRPSERANREQPESIIRRPTRQSTGRTTAPRHPSSAPDPGVASRPRGLNRARAGPQAGPAR
jgi:hypothetical protein